MAVMVQLFMRKLLDEKDEGWIAKEHDIV